jgi:O-antigen ligase
VLAVPLVLWSAWRLLDVPQSAGGRRARTVLLVCLMTAALPLVQLVPLPPALWTSLPGRADFVQTLAAAGLEAGWMPLTVSPSSTWLSALALLPPVAVLMSAVQLDFADRRRLVLVVLTVGVAGAVLGFVQIAQGPASPLRFYAVTNPTEAVGLFANRNHYAALLNCLLPFAVAWSVAAVMRAARGGPWRSRRATPHLIVVIIGVAVVMLLVGAQFMARSRAGLGLMIVAVLGSIAMVYAIPGDASDPRPATSRGGVARIFIWLLLAAVGLAAAIGAQSGFHRLRARSMEQLLTDGRIPLARNTFDAAMAYMPFGSGMGTFVQIYQAFETAADGFTFSYVNRAHNDFLELWLEAGLAGLAAILLFLVWVVRAGLRVWRRGLPGAGRVDNLFACAAAIVLTTLLAHSGVDYPLRTTALIAVFVLAAALLIVPVGATVASARPPGAPTEIEVAARPEAPSKDEVLARSEGIKAAAPPRGEWPPAWRTPTRSGRSDTSQ